MFSHVKFLEHPSIQHKSSCKRFLLHSDCCQVSEQHEKEASLVRELERLRTHLVAVEDNYTQEMVRAEKQVSELTHRLTLAEERAKSSSTAYTSAK